MPPKTNLQYTAPKVPSFLQKLHAQVNNSSGRSGAEAYGEALRPDEGDDLAALVGSSNSGGGGRDAEDVVASRDDDPEDEDEWQGAQVVVLKEGKHLTEDEIGALRSKEKSEASEEKDKAQKATQEALTRAQISSSIGSAPLSKRKRRGDITTATNNDDSSISSSDDDKAAPTRSSKGNSKDTLAGAKELIEAERQRKLKETKRRDKERQKQKKNKVAKKEIGKRGKGLSFEFQD